MAASVVGRFALSEDVNVLVCGLDACCIEDGCKIAESLGIFPLCAAWSKDYNEIL